MKTPRTAIVAPHHEHPRPLPRLPHGAARSHGPRSAGSNPALRRVVLGGVLLAGALLWCAGSDLSAASSSPPDLPDPAERLRLLEAERPQGQAPAELRRGKGSLASSSEMGHRAGDDYDLRHVLLEIDVSDTTGETIRGVATEVLTSTTPTLGQITMDLIDAMTVESVEVDGSSAPFLHTQDLLTVTLGTPIPEGESATVRVSYHGHPPQDGYGLYFDTHAGRSFIWTISEPSDARRWWPVKDRPDDKADSCRVRITAPVSMTATSNGRLESTAPGLSGTQVWTWVERHPIAPYLICVNAGDFEVVSDSWDRPGGGTMPIDSYVFPEQMGAAATDFSIAPGALSAFSERFGIYPFADEKYGITVFGWGGGMEHQTNTSYGHFLITGDHRYDWIYVHELSHQWWGDNVTCATWADTWLNEGFASWCEALWYEHEGGFGAYRDYMTQSQRVRDPSGPIYDYPDPFDGNTIYNKGAWAAHMLRGVLGDSVMFSALADYRVAYQNRSVTTEQLRASLEASSGRDLSWFFDEWIYGMNRPHYRVSSFAESHGSGQRVYVHLDQTQADPYFTMPVQIRVQAGVEEKTAVLFNDPDHEDLVVDLESGGPVSVTVDPDQWILRTVESGAYELNLITTALPAAATGASVSDTLVARGGTPPYSWQAIDALPAGIVLGLHDGVLSGTPTQDGDYAFRVEVSDSSVPVQTDVQTIRWTIATSAGTPPPSTWMDGPELEVSPNPAFGSVLLAFSSSVAGPVEFGVFDLTGRQVASGRSTSSDAASARSWKWDGLEGTGRHAPAGMYWVRARVGTSSAAQTATGKVLLLRR